MKSLVTTKGQVTIPKALREQFGIAPGAEVDFVATKDGIRLQKVVDPEIHDSVLGCLKEELSGRTAGAWLEKLRGTVDLPRPSKRARCK